MNPWLEEVVDAADADNLKPETPCASSLTLAALKGASGVPEEQVGLAIEDFERAGTQDLRMLRSDAVAARFAPETGRSPNVCVARMTVPGGPWPGHYGLEVVSFTAREARMPDWFPPIDGDYSLHFAKLMVCTKGFREGSGTVLFPEQLSVIVRPPTETFGVVFLERLAEFYEQEVVPVLHPANVTEPEDVLAIREMAFLAHEWGHVATPLFGAAVVARRRRFIAVVSEIQADLSAILMLSDAAEPLAVAASAVLVADRVIRDSWLPRPHAQVDSIAARHLYRLLLESGGVTVIGGQLRISLDRALGRLADESEQVQQVMDACAEGDTEEARRFLSRSGWHIADEHCVLPVEPPQLVAARGAS